MLDFLELRWYHVILTPLDFIPWAFFLGEIMFISHDDTIALRSFKTSDLYDLYEFSKEPLIGFNAGWRPHMNLEMSKKVLDCKILNSNSYAIVLIKENKVIGSLEFYKSHIRPTINSMEVGFVINKNYWGHGYAKRALNLALEYAFLKKNYFEFKPSIIEACHIVDNTRCEHTLLSCGFKYEGTLRKYKKLYDNRIIDIKLYSILKEDYERMNIK